MLSVLLNIFFIGIFTFQLLDSSTEKTKRLEEYSQFINYGKDVDFLFNLLSEQAPKEETTRYVFDIYNNLIAWDEKLTQFQQNSSFFSKLNTIELLPRFDEMIINIRSVMYAQFKESNTWKSEEFQLYKKAIHELVENLPSEYSKSKSFNADFNKAVDEFNKLVTSN